MAQAPVHACVTSQQPVHGELTLPAFMLAAGEWRGLRVAVKRVLLQALAGEEGEEARAAVLREAHINASLDHPNIVATYACDLLPLPHTKEGEKV